jgi:RNA polymerase sigma-70 factor (ECF subfamily)
MRAQVVLARQPLEQEFERAYAEFAREVFRFVLAWTNDWAAAEDLTQEAYLRLWRHRGNVDWERPIVPWLLVTARRLASNRFRQVRRSFPLLVASHPSDEAVRVRWLDVRRAFGGLSQLERTALIMTAVEGWSYGDVAEVLQTSEGALRAAVSRARDKLEAA